MAFDTSAFQEYFKLFNPNSNPNVDLAKYSEIQQKTIETITQANKAWFDGLQKIVKAQSEFAQEQAQAAANVASKILSGKSPEENIDTQTKYAQNVFDANVQNIQSVAKSASDTSVKVFDIINKQAVQNLSDFAASNNANPKRKTS